ncbi:MAG: T9SS type A sorting domain-containing protein [Elusimicrobia bacterium]|nr:T9SS type A sorting domain-containing protein [Elusimicrobiota bacterium]
MKIKKIISFNIIILFCINAGWTAGSVVQITGTKGNWKLMVNGQEYYIKGLGFAATVSQSNIDSYMQDLQEMGVNSVRTWGLDLDKHQILLDSSQKYGITVDVGFWLNFNHDYVNDPQGYKTSRLNEIKVHVQALKDYPALLMWNVGNEALESLDSEANKIAYAEYVDDICEAIKLIDPNHPTTSTSINTISWPYFKNNTPNLDIYAANAYGYLGGIYSDWQNGGYTVPYIITEFGPTGDSEASKDENGVPIEMTDQQKSGWYGSKFTTLIQAHQGANFGGYAFYYTGENSDGNFSYGMTWKGMRRPQFIGLYEAYTGLAASNKAPVVNSVNYNYMDSNNKVFVNIDAYDPEGETLSYYMQKYNDPINQNIHSIKDVTIDTIRSSTITFTSPGSSVCQLYVCVADGSGNVNITPTSWPKSLPLPPATLTSTPPSPSDPVRNYPNPFNPDKEKTRIEFSIDEEADVKMEIYDITGNLIYKKQLPKLLVYREVYWDGKTENGTVPNGVYICRIEAESSTKFEVRYGKIAVVKNR